MKKFYVLFIALFFVFASCTKDNPVEPQSADPTGNYKFDVKTELIEKFANAGAKAGLKANIENSGWAEVVEFGEEYSMYIVNAERDPKSNIIHLEFDFELREPEFIIKGKLLKIKHYSIDYDIKAEWDNTANIPDTKALMTWLEKEITKMRKNDIIDGFFGGTLAKADKVVGILNKCMKYLDPTDSAQKQAEAVLVGTLCYSQLRSWMLEHEAGKW